MERGEVPLAGAQRRGGQTTTKLAPSPVAPLTSPSLAARHALALTQPSRIGGSGTDLLAVVGRRRAAWGWWQWLRVLLGGAGGVAVVLALAYYAYCRFVRRPPPSTAARSATHTAATARPATARAATAHATMPKTMGAMAAADGDVEVAAAVGLLSSVKGRRVTCATRGVVLEFDNDGGGGHRRPRLIESAVPVLQQLARHSDLYLITECDDDSTEEAVRSLLAERGLLAAGLNPHKVLFCSTALGRVHMARQLESHMHIDGNAAVAEGLHRHVARLGVVAAAGPLPERGGAEGVRWAATLSEMFGSRE